MRQIINSNLSLEDVLSQMVVSIVNKEVMASTEDMGYGLNASNTQPINVQSPSKLYTVLEKIEDDILTSIKYKCEEYITGNIAVLSEGSTTGMVLLPTIGSKVDGTVNGLGINTVTRKTDIEVYRMQYIKGVGSGLDIISLDPDNAYEKTVKFRLADKLTEIKTDFIKLQCKTDDPNTSDKEGGILFNGDAFGGLVKIQELTDKINKLVDEVKAINDRLTEHKHTYNAYPSVPTSTSAPEQLPIPPTPYIPVPDPTPFDKSDYENTTVKHGNTTT